MKLVQINSLNMIVPVAYVEHGMYLRHATSSLAISVSLTPEFTETGLNVTLDLASTSMATIATCPEVLCHMSRTASPHLAALAKEEKQADEDDEEEDVDGETFVGFGKMTEEEMRDLLATELGNLDLETFKVLVKGTRFPKGNRASTTDHVVNQFIDGLLEADGDLREFDEETPNILQLSLDRGIPLGALSEVYSHVINDENAEDAISFENAVDRVLGLNGDDEDEEEPTPVVYLREGSDLLESSGSFDVDPIVNAYNIIARNTPEVSRETIQSLGQQIGKYQDIFERIENFQAKPAASASIFEGDAEENPFEDLNERLTHNAEEVGSSLDGLRAQLDSSKRKIVALFEELPTITIEILPNVNLDSLVEGAAGDKTLLNSLIALRLLENVNVNPAFTPVYREDNKLRYDLEISDDAHDKIMDIFNSVKAHAENFVRSEIREL